MAKKDEEKKALCHNHFSFSINTCSYLKHDFIIHSILLAPRIPHITQSLDIIFFFLPFMLHSFTFFFCLRISFYYISIVISSTSCSSHTQWAIKIIVLDIIKQIATFIRDKIRAKCERERERVRKEIYRNWNKHTILLLIFLILIFFLHLNSI